VISDMGPFGVWGSLFENLLKIVQNYQNILKNTKRILGSDLPCSFSIELFSFSSSQKENDQKQLS
jgi:hypothetical protein